MQKGFEERRGGNLLSWLSPLGQATRLFCLSLSYDSWRTFSWRDFKRYCGWLGPRSFHFIALAGVAISLAMTIECVLELQKYRAQDLAGAVISIGLLRELAPLTLSTAWCASVAALIAGECKWYRWQYQDDGELAASFVLPRYLAALCMSLPLSGYGLIIGFVTGALFAPLLGVTSINDFFEAARQATHDTDIIVFFIKLVAVNPTVGVFAGCAAGMAATSTKDPVEAKAVVATALACYLINLGITAVFYLVGGSS